MGLWCFVNHVRSSIKLLPYLGIHSIQVVYMHYNTISAAKWPQLSVNWITAWLQLLKHQNKTTLLRVTYSCHVFIQSQKTTHHKSWEISFEFTLHESWNQNITHQWVRSTQYLWERIRLYMIDFDFCIPSTLTECSTWIPENHMRHWNNVVIISFQKAQFGTEP